MRCSHLPLSQNCHHGRPGATSHGTVATSIILYRFGGLNSEQISRPSLNHWYRLGYNYRIPPAGLYSGLLGPSGPSCCVASFWLLNGLSDPGVHGGRLYPSAALVTRRGPGRQSLLFDPALVGDEPELPGFVLVGSPRATSVQSAISHNELNRKETYLRTN